MKKIFYLGWILDLFLIVKVSETNVICYLLVTFIAPSPTRMSEELVTKTPRKQPEPISKYLRWSLCIARCEQREETLIISSENILFDVEWPRSRGDRKIKMRGYLTCIQRCKYPKQNACKPNISTYRKMMHLIQSILRMEIALTLGNQLI